MKQAHDENHVTPKHHTKTNTHTNNMAEYTKILLGFV